jgi:Nif-specific regulatory protein
MQEGIPDSERFSLLLDLCRAFSALMELDELIPFIIARTREVLQAENCAILLLDEKRQELVVPVTSDVNPEVEKRFQGLRFPADKGIAGWVLHEGKALLIPDVSQDTRWYTGVDKHTGAHTHDLLYAPLRTKHGIIGMIGLRNKQVGTFTNEDLHFLDALSGSMAIAIENARLYQHVRQSEARLQAEVAILHREMIHHRRFTEIIGTAPAMEPVFRLMASALSSSITVLLEGETGTGKDLIARTIHHHGPRKDRPFVAVNCGALPDTLLESELFGHKKGSFTGALQDKPGLFEVADGGTIFLDEIGETSRTMQVKLLQVLQEGEIRRVGEIQSRRVDVRVISATNRDLVQEVQRKRFRADLYYRLSVFPIRVPSLRERREDIPLLATHFLRQSDTNADKQIPDIAPEALEKLVQYAWPGNVRELKNEVERAVALAPDQTPITVEHLSERIVSQTTLHIPFSPKIQSLKQARSAFERDYITTLLQHNQGNVIKTAKALGISRQMLQRKIKTLGLRDQ